MVVVCLVASSSIACIANVRVFPIIPFDLHVPWAGPGAIVEEYKSCLEGPLRDALA